MQKTLSLYLTVFFVASCDRAPTFPTKTKTSISKPGLELSILEFVTRDTLKKHRVRKIHQVITADANFASKDSEDRSGIYYTYYFDKEGRLEASTPGYTSSTTNFIYDDEGRNASYSWTDSYSGKLDAEAEIIKNEVPYFMAWETNIAKPEQTLSIHSPCYSVIAEFSVEHSKSIDQNLPTAGQAVFVKTLGKDGMMRDNTNKLYIIYTYTFDK